MTRHRSKGLDLVAGLLVLGSGLSGCDSPTAPAAVATVSVTVPASTLVVGETMQATAIVRDARGRVLADRAIEWSSSDNALAMVSGTGLISAIAPGPVTITARSEGQAGEAELTVLPVPVAAVSISPDTATLQVGATRELTVTVRDAAGNVLTGRAVEWSSSDDAVAGVAQDGTVTAVAEGTATITAVSEGQSGTAGITVVPVPVATVSISPDTATLQVGATRELTVTVRDAAGNVLTGRAVEWSSSDDAVAGVAQDGTVTAVAEGTATITATSEGQTGTAGITVVAPPPPPLAAPAGVKAERRSRLRARVSWDATDGAEEYRVDRMISGGEWTEVETTTALAFIDEDPRSRGAQYDYRITAIGDGRISPPSSIVSTVVPSIRLALIGDSNLARGQDGSSTVATSYVEGGSLSIDPNGYPDHPKLLSGKIMALRPDIEAVNHGISNTRTGTGTVSGKPHALHSIDGTTRFEAEVLGEGYPWTAMSIPRVNAFTPTAEDFGYYSLGINDITGGIAPETIRDNIGIAIDLWLAAGLPAAHLMVTTLGPRAGHANEANIPVTNQLIRELVSAKAVSLVDIAALVSDDDGLTWKDAGLHTGDGLHYTETTLDLIAAEINTVMSSHTP